MIVLCWYLCCVFCYSCLLTIYPGGVIEEHPFRISKHRMLLLVLFISLGSTAVLKLTRFFSLSHIGVDGKKFYNE